MNILFIEDRPFRREHFLPNGQKDIMRMKSIKGLTMPDGDESKKIINEINLKKYGFPTNPKLIIIHKTSLDTLGQTFVDSTCKSRKIDLVFFSGGISQLFYNSDGYNFLSMNSSALYSDNLISFLQRFCDNEKPHLLEIANNNWKLAYLYLARQLFDSLESEEDEDRIYAFNSKLDYIRKTVGMSLATAQETDNTIQKTTLLL
jgi:hypothetical protein